METAASTLEELVAPLSQAEFLSLLRERKLTHLRGTNGDRYRDVVGWDALRRMIERDEYSREPDHFRLSKESAMLPRERWSSNGKVDLAKVQDHLAKGYSVILTHIEQHVPALAAICNEIKSRLSESAYAGVIVTEGTGDGAFKVHYDFEDLIILQIEGTKRWQFFGPPVFNPIRGMPKQTPPDSAPIFDDVLEPGDFLFVPRGHWHHCENGLGRSIHLGIFFTPPTGWHAVRALTSQLLSEEIFRTPLTRFEGASELDALEADVKNRLIEKIGQLKLAEFLTEWNKQRLSVRAPLP